LPIPTGIPADILLTRPDVRMAERQYAQYTAKIGQAEAARYPSVSLTGDISTTALKLGDLGKNSTIGWSFGPSLSVPLFNGGQLQAAVDVARAQRDQYFVAYKAAVLTALEDVENATVSLSQERIRNGKLASSAKSYGDAARLERTLYKAGEASLLDVLDAERSAYSAEDSLLQSRVSIATDYVALNKALGGGWDGAIDSATPEIIDVKTGPRLASEPQRNE
ncbi:MAG: RND transporter, partial [Mesorhizobium sp.]